MPSMWAGSIAAAMALKGARGGVRDAKKDTLRVENAANAAPAVAPRKNLHPPLRRRRSTSANVNNESLLLVVV